MAGNIGVELNLAVGKINHVSLNFIPPTFNTCIETLGAYMYLLKCIYIEFYFDFE